MIIEYNYITLVKIQSIGLSNVNLNKRDMYPVILNIQKFFG